MNSVLFSCETWLGSCGRSFREALVRQGVRVDDMAEEAFFPKWTDPRLRILVRTTHRMIVREFQDAIVGRAERLRPRAIIAYKGTYVASETLHRLRELGIRTINIYPDVNPLAHGKVLAESMGEYDLVVSTKSWHPNAWRQMFGYRNRCVFIPHGYDPSLHFVPIEGLAASCDVSMVATYRPEYGRMIEALAREPGMADVSFRLFGNGWQRLRRFLPSRWVICGPVSGLEYPEVVRHARVLVAPLTRAVTVGGRAYPGDEDTTRTYELPAMGAFVIHRRTERARSLFDEDSEMPMFDSPQELAEQIRRGLADPDRREAMRRRAQERAVPRDSLDNRAAEFIGILKREGLADLTGG